MKNWLIQQLTKLKECIRPSAIDITMPTLMSQLKWQDQLNDQNFKLRLCQQGDIRYFEQMERACYDGYLAWREADFFKDWKRNPYALYLVVEKEGTVVGLINGRVRYQSSHISQVMVLPAFQHLGVGEWLVTEWLRIASVLKTKQVTLEVRESNLRAQNLYTKLGFRIIDQRENYYYNNQETALIMCRREKE